MTTHLDTLIHLLSRAHDADCPLDHMSEKYCIAYVAECTCSVKPEVERLLEGLVPWADEVPA
jgi:hypothetical protein